MGKSSAKAGKKLGSLDKDASGIPFFGFLKAALSFSFRPKRFLPFFVVGLLLLFAEMQFVMSGIDSDILLMYAETGIPDSQIPVFAGLAFVQVLGWIAGLLVTGAVLYQAVHPSDDRKSWTVAARRLPSLAAASLIIIILSAVISLSAGVAILEYAGIAVLVIVTLAFLFINQFIVLSGTRFDRAFCESARLFFRKPLPVMLSGIFMWFAALLLIVAFAAPLTIMLYAYLGPDVTIDSTGALFAAGGLEMKLAFVASLLGEAIAKVFMLKFLADVFLDLCKKKWILF